ncbi:hypothetical protein GCM10007203_13330 [Staphylococcus nepalensis]|jgi:hypothetical protein|nr:hypothetical protein GCM10007203_13330 [Staphylococcus nepalensis]
MPHSMHLIILFVTKLHALLKSIDNFLGGPNRFSFFMFSVNKSYRFDVLTSITNRLSQIALLYFVQKIVRLCIIRLYKSVA